MKTLGLDIGTTTISGAIAEDGRVLKTLTRANDSLLCKKETWESLQNPRRILAIVLEMAQELLEQAPEMRRIGLTGQMHGIVYLDKDGLPVSPLFTWQDARAEQKMPDGMTYTDALNQLTGYEVASGYGLATHYYNLKNGLVPEDATVFCTIQDYVAMSLAGLKRPITDCSDAASFGFFDVEMGRYDRQALEKAGIDPCMLPELSKDVVIGTWGNREVCLPIGDNQASFLGAGGIRQSMLVNVGTGSQFSAYSDRFVRCDGLETRPFPGGGYLLVGASICGGRAYALLESFFRAVGRMLGCERDSAYEAMAKLLDSGPQPEDIPVVMPLFQGTRADPTVCGSINGLRTTNFTPQHLIWGVMEGMASELAQMYATYRRSGGTCTQLFGSGNGLRKNPYLCSCICSAFGQAVILSRCEEEAAAGAAMFAAKKGNPN